MRTKEEMLKELEEASNDERLKYPPANVMINAPLALVQVALKNKIVTLRWALGDDAPPLPAVPEIQYKVV